MTPDVLDLHHQTIGFLLSVQGNHILSMRTVRVSLLTVRYCVNQLNITLIHTHTHPIMNAQVFLFIETKNIPNSNNSDS